MQPKNYYITTPIYYVNDAPHIGHAYTSIACDVLARFFRLDGYDVRYMTGTDEHGQKIARSAEKAGMHPQDFTDKVSQTFRDMSKKLDIRYDVFMRTTDPKHYLCAQELWTRLVDRGEIYLGSYSGWYAIRDEAYYDESELVDGKAPTGAEVEWVEEPSYFFKLSKWQEPLLDFYKNNPDFIGPSSRRNEVIRFVEGGLNDLSVSRTTLSWGVPVPNLPKDGPRHVMYVWLEALSVYLSNLGFPENKEQVDKFWPHVVHMMGKDILRFHAIYWPAFLMAADMLPPKRVFAHGWWTNEGQKISKSLGNTIDPLELVDAYGVDQVRYFLLREVPFGQDGDFSKTALVSRINSDLANDYGNLAQRVLSFVYKNCDAKIPQCGALEKQDETILNSASKIICDLRSELSQQAIHKYVEKLWSLIGEANRYIDQEKPWGLKKTDEVRMQTVLYVLLEVIRHVAILSQPVIPNAAEKLLDTLSVANDKRTFSSLNEKLTSGATIKEPSGLFPRI